MWDVQLVIAEFIVLCRVYGDGKDKTGCMTQLK